jgi:hypothetical protein
MRLRSLIEKLVGSRFVRGGERHPMAPPVLEEPLRFPYGPFRWKAHLPKERSYTILTSTDLRTWMPISQGTAREGLIEYVDSDAFKFPYRFYRLLSEEGFFHDRKPV